MIKYKKHPIISLQTEWKTDPSSLLLWADKSMLLGSQGKWVCMAQPEQLWVDPENWQPDESIAEWPTMHEMAYCRTVRLYSTVETEHVSFLGPNNKYS